MAIFAGAREGGWVVLQNLHHALEWLPTLANIIIRLYTSNTTKGNLRNHSINGTLNPNFRLILTSEPTDKVMNSYSLVLAYKQNTYC